jgi:transcriptional regulator with XRE-family HTH domain
MALAVGKRMRELRKELKFGFDAFVGETELGRGFVSELERGLTVPTIHTLAHIAAAFELTVADLVVTDATARERLFEATRGLDEAEVEELLRMAKARRRP